MYLIVKLMEITLLGFFMDVGTKWGRREMNRMPSLKSEEKVTQSSWVTLRLMMSGHDHLHDS